MGHTLLVRSVPMAMLLMLMLPGCGDRATTLPSDGGSSAGTQGGLCYPNGTCNSGLRCSQGRCQKAFDGGPGPDTSVALPDGYGPLGPCAVPGQACDAKDLCAINPVCGEDHQCHPSRLQSCDDGLPCTRDSCLGMGLCENKPDPGFCVVLAAGKAPACVSDGSRNPDDPCQVCDGAGQPLGWSPANGGTCDDKDPCTKEDYCQLGICKGIYYGSQCDDGLGCTDDTCDGKGGCLPHLLLPGSCAISGTCYKDGDQDPAGCGTCQVATSTSQWTPLTSFCTMQGKCFKPGAVAPDGCGTCVPAASATAWTPLAGGTFCKIGAVCVAAGAKHSQGCASCDPSKSATAWTVASGCLIANACYAAAQSDGTGCSTCDPTKSMTAWTPVPGTCSIGGKCYKPNDPHPTGACAKCDPSLSAAAWTPTGTGCLISNKCAASGGADPLGCGTCDPTKSTTAWTPLPGKCRIGDACFANGAIGPFGCAVCDTAKSTTSWTPGPGVTSVSYGFEDGKNPPAGWTVQSSDATVGWSVVNKRPGFGTYSLYYGNPTVWNFDTPGKANTGTATTPAVTLSTAKKAALTFLVYLDTETGSYDDLTVKVNGAAVWTKSSLSVTTKSWMSVTVDLVAFAGQTVTIAFAFDTGDQTSNSTEGVYLDEVTIYHGC